MQGNISPRAVPYAATPLADFGQLQQRYQSVTLAQRAQMVLADAQPALQIAESILQKLAGSNPVKQVLAKMRGNALLAGKMRPSGARDLMIDGSADFIAGSLHKLAAWRKTMERLGSGEDIVSIGGRETVPAASPLALAIAGNACVSNYLSVVQLALSELIRNDRKNATSYRALLSDIRRCATVLSDCEYASGIASLVG